MYLVFFFGAISLLVLAALPVAGPRVSSLVVAVLVVAGRLLRVVVPPASGSAVDRDRFLIWRPQDRVQFLSFDINEGTDITDQGIRPNSHQAQHGQRSCRDAWMKAEPYRFVVSEF
jgi:hypothetical protein